MYQIFQPENVLDVDLTIVQAVVLRTSKHFCVPFIGLILFTYFVFGSVYLFCVRLFEQGVRYNLPSCILLFNSQGSRPSAHCCIFWGGEFFFRGASGFLDACPRNLTFECEDFSAFCVAIRCGHFKFIFSGKWDLGYRFWGL